MRKFNTRNAINGSAIVNGDTTFCAKSNLLRVSDATHFYLCGMSVSTTTEMPGISTGLSRANDQGFGPIGASGLTSHWRYETRIGQTGERGKPGLQHPQAGGLGMPVAGLQTLGNVASEPTARLGMS